MMPTITSTADTLGRPYNLVEVDWSDVVAVPGGMNLSGTDDIASTPDAARFDIVGDIDLRAFVTTSAWFTDSDTLISKYLPTGNQRTWRFLHSATGNLVFGWSLDGIVVTSATSTVPVVPDADGRLAVRVAFDADDGLGNSVATFYTAPDIAGPWTQLGAAVTTAGVVAMFSSTADVIVGAESLGAAEFTGTVHSAQIRDGIDGLVVGFPRFDLQPSGTDVFTDEVGTVWTLGGDAYIYATVAAPQAVAVYRVDEQTCARTALRPYVCFTGDCMELSCDGTAIFWDTEVPFDRPYHYVTEACPDALASDCVLDTFTRGDANAWTPSDSGHVWTLTGGTVPGDYDIDGQAGLQSHSTVNVFRASTLTLGASDMTGYVDVMLPVSSATGAPIAPWFCFRETDGLNHYIARLILSGTTLTLSLDKRVAGVLTSLGSTIVDASYSAGQWYRISVSAIGTRIKAKARPRLDPEPSGWIFDVVDTSLTTGTLIGLRSRLEAGNTNVLPVIFSWDNLFACPSCPTVTETAAQTLSATQAGTGEFWISDPVRPYKDQAVPLCFPTDVDIRPDGSYCTTPASTLCVPDRGVFFVAMDVEGYASNSGLLNPTNAKHPIQMHRTRRSVSSTLSVATRTFADRDAMLDLNEPGSPLLLRGPDEYGIPDRYMAVGDVDVARIDSDHRFQVRGVRMPHVAVQRPAGPTQGICGNRMADMCNEYATVGDIATAGITWGGLLRGEAGGI